MKRTNIIASTVVALLALTANAQGKKPLSAAEQAKLDRYNETYNAELDARLKRGMSFEQAEAEAYHIGKTEHAGRGTEVEQLKIVKKPAAPKAEVKKAVAPVAATTSAQVTPPVTKPVVKPEIAKQPEPAKTMAVKPASKIDAQAAAPAPAEPISATGNPGWVDPPKKDATAATQDKQSIRSGAWVDVPAKKAGDSDQMKAAIVMKERAELKVQEITGCKMNGSEQTCTCVRGLTNSARLDKLTGAKALVSEAKAMVPTLDVAKLESEVAEVMSATAQKEDYCDRVTRMKHEAAEKKAAESGIDRSKVRVVGDKIPAYNTSYTPDGKKGVAGGVRID